MITLTKKQLIIAIGIVILVISVIGYYIYTQINIEDYQELDQISGDINALETKEKIENEEEIVIVHIAGQVKQPGIVRIKEGSRIADIIEKAGGLTEDADITNVNLAYIIEDGQKITIPSKSTTFIGTECKEYITVQNGDSIIDEEYNLKKGENAMININKATLEELQTLQGIGEATAQKIIDYRKQNGEFKQIEDIKNVPGIGDAKFENIKNNICVK